MLRRRGDRRLTRVMQHFCSFGSQPSHTPSQPAWWGDRLSLFPNSDSAVAAAYELYAESFRSIRETSIIRAHLERNEFDSVLNSSTSFNIGVFDDDRLVGICSLDTDVATNPALNPIALQRRYPDQFARAAVYYCWFMATRDGSRKEMLALSHIVEGIVELVAERQRSRARRSPVTPPCSPRLGSRRLLGQRPGVRL